MISASVIVEVLEVSSAASEPLDFLLSELDEPEDASESEESPEPDESEEESESEESPEPDMVTRKSEIETDQGSEPNHLVRMASSRPPADILSNSVEIALARPDAFAGTAIPVVSAAEIVPIKETPAYAHATYAPEAASQTTY